MKRWTILLLVLLGAAVIGGAGYLGLTGASQDALPAAAQESTAPTTVEVTRGDVQQTVIAPGHLIDVQQTTLSPQVCGQLTQVDVRPGDQVQTGDVLARFSTAPFEEKLLSAQADLELVQARLDQIEAGPTPAELVAARYALANAQARLDQLQAGPSLAELATAEAIVASARNDLAHLESLPDAHRAAQAQAELDRATVTLQQAQAAYDRVHDRPDVGMLPQALELQQATISFDAARAALAAASRPATPTELEVARARLAAVQADLAQIQTGPSDDELALAELARAQAEAELAQLSAGPLTADLKQAQVALLAAEMALKKAQADLDAANLTAPFGGIVLEVWAGQGKVVCPGDDLVVLSDPTALKVESTVIEEDLPLVQVGQTVELFFDARPEALIAGRVERIIPQRNPGSDRPLYPIHIEPQKVPEGLVAGMTADAAIIIAHRKDVLRLPRALARPRSDDTAEVKVWAGGEIEVRIVKVGLRGDVYVEIREGLREGEQVVGQ